MDKAEPKDRIRQTVYGALKFYSTDHTTKRRSL